MSSFVFPWRLQFFRKYTRNKGVDLYSQHCLLLVDVGLLLYAGRLLEVRGLLEAGGLLEVGRLLEVLLRGLLEVGWLLNRGLLEAVGLLLEGLLSHWGTRFWEKNHHYQVSCYTVQQFCWHCILITISLFFLVISIIEHLLTLEGLLEGLLLWELLLLLHLHLLLLLHELLLLLLLLLLHKLLVVSGFAFVQLMPGSAFLDLWRM